MGVAPGVLRRLEPAPQDGTDSQGLEIVGRHDAAGGVLGPVADAERGAEDAVDDEHVDQLAVPLEVLDVGP